MHADQFTQRKSPQPLSEEGYALMGAAFEVHDVVGGGLLEDIYQECLERELHLRSIPYQSKQEVAIYYKNHELRKRYIPDLFVHEQIVVELKAVKELTPENEAQVMNYMRISQTPVGYLINFGPLSGVEWKRLVLSEFLNR